MVTTYIVQQINDTGHWEDILTTTDRDRARERQQELGQSGRLLEFNSSARTRAARTTVEDSATVRRLQTLRGGRRGRV